MKKILLLLFVIAVAFTACQKDTGTKVNIRPGDLSAINGQLRGTWVFPVQTLSIVDTAGKMLAPNQSLSSPAFRFDGNSKVTIMPDIHTELQGTYSLTTDKGFIYLYIQYPDGNGVQYQVLQVSAQMLKLNSTQPYTYYNGPTPTPAKAVTKTVLMKQSAADVTGNLVRVAVNSDSIYNVGVYVTHSNAMPGDTATLLNSQVNVTGAYSYSFVAKPGDHLTIDIFGSFTKTSYYAYYNGLPLSGEVHTHYNEIKTDTGWDIP